MSIEIFFLINNDIVWSFWNRCTRKWKIIFVLTILLLLIIVATLLLLFLIQPKTIKNTKSKIIGLNPILRWNSTGITVAGISGVNGTNSTLLDYPWGLALNYENTLYVADRFNNRVQKFLKNSSIGVTVAGQANGTAIFWPPYLYYPAAIILDSNENLYIGDAYFNRVQLWIKGASSGSTVAGSGKKD